MSVLALVPARSGSKGIPGKNWRKLGQQTLVERAIQCGLLVPCDRVALSSDIAEPFEYGPCIAIQRPADLAQDDTPMLDVVTHALAQIPGPEEQIIVLLQPTQPFRTPEHVRAAIDLLKESGADSVVSVVELPKTHSPELVLHVGDDYVVPWLREWGFSHCDHLQTWQDRPTRRQDARPAHKPDGTVYAFRRATVSRYGSIYGQDVRPLIIPPEQSCELDSIEDWERVQARWEAQHG